ncbi:hypothetical protein OIU78_020255 [Salix suchowensis]|nr:hypothetical protein OIU78_020255 [Salix suchowensis]
MVDNNMATVLSKVLSRSWEVRTNFADHPNGRIAVGWDASKVQLQCIDSSAQWLTVEIRNHHCIAGMRLTFVYGFNSYGERSALWNYIQRASEDNKDTPWAIMGDFNAILRPCDRSGGASDWQRHHGDFPDCINRSSLLQIPYNGIRLSWHNGQSGHNTILKKLDWVFGNMALVTRWPAVRANFLPRQCSDHSAMVMRLEPPNAREKSPFKFLNQWADHGDFQDIVKEVWRSRIAGNHMFQFTSKLNILKMRLRDKHRRCTSHISHKVFQAQERWHVAQRNLDIDPHNDGLRENERLHAGRFFELCREEEAYFKQRSRVQWLNLGDHNTRFFHKSLIHRSARNEISSLMAADGSVITDNKEMGEHAVHYFKNLLQSSGTSSAFNAINVANLYSKAINEESQDLLKIPISDKEIKDALFDIPDDKAPGPDGVFSTPLTCPDV